MRIGITGHQELVDPTNWQWVKNEFHSLLQQYNNSLIGVTSLAVGADQYFAQAVLERGGALEVVIPFDSYESVFDEKDRSEYRRLLQRAVRISTLAEESSHEKAFLKAGKTIVDNVNLLVAVWDGYSAAGLGGTADVVEYAIKYGRPTLQLNPITLTVSQLLKSEDH
jgi:uncharacterized phage-like protein YoqJ